VTEKKSIHSASIDIPDMISAGMGEYLHWFPADVADTRLAVTMAGMANTQGGTIILGVAPRSREIHGIQDLETALDLVFRATLLSDPPLVIPIPRSVQVGKAQTLLITIPAGLPNVYNVDGRYWGREGTQTNPLPARRLRELLLERGVVQFETRLPANASLEDLDLAKAQVYLQTLELPGDEPFEEVLLRRGCLQKIEDRLVPTYAAVLLFGRHPQQWLPNATLMAVRFQGMGFSDEFIRQEIRGTLPEQLQQAEVFLRANLRSVVRLKGLVHEEALEYPFEAVRELLVNAVAHRDYNIQGDNIHLHIFSDRLEVQSPGKLPGPVTLENLLEARFSRNAVITQVLSDLGYVERLGYGLDRVVTVLRENGMRPPRFEETAGTFRVTIFNDLGFDSQGKPALDLGSYSEMGINPRQSMVLKHLARQRRITNRDYQELCPDVHVETLRRDLADLTSKGIIIKIGDKKSTYYILKRS
jgi:ATP-dependent DNA helicase RecG